MKRIVFLSVAVIAFWLKATSQTSNPQQYKYVFTVAKDGSGDYKFIQDAIDAMRVYPLAPITLYIKNGVYNEKIELPSSNTDVRFIGESVDSTIITFNDHTGRGKINTFTSYTAKICGNRFYAENISFVNAAGPVGQAVALHVEADQAVFRHCKFLGHQDTIYASGENARQLFIDCFIEGTTDFIFGPATAVFQTCTIRCKTNSYITAASTPAWKAYGYVFRDCKIITDSSVHKMYLGRPWRSHAKTVFIRCELPASIAPAGWDFWGNVANQQTAYYAEYKNFGAGAHPTQRAAWTKQLSDVEVKKYELSDIFGPLKNNELWYLSKDLVGFQWPAASPSQK